MTIQNYKDRHYELEWENLGIRGCIVLNNMNGNLRYEESDNENGKDFDDKEKSRMTFMTKWFNPGSRIFLTNLKNPTYQKFKYLPVSDLIEVFFSLSSRCWKGRRKDSQKGQNYPLDLNKLVSVSFISHDNNIFEKKRKKCF